MNLQKNIKHYIILTLITTLFFNCTKEDICTKRVNIPIWDETKEIFVDNFQELPCDFNGITKRISEFTLNEKKELVLKFKNKETLRTFEYSLQN